MFIHLSYEFPSIVKDELIIDFNRECTLFEYAACLYLLISKQPSKPVGKGALSNLIFIINCLEESGYL
jgi:hypothetical protein